MNDLDELNFTPLPPVTDQDLAMVRGVVNSNRLHMIKGLASVPLSEEFDFLGCDGRPIRIPDSVRHPGHKLEGAAQAAHMLRLTLTGDPKLALDSEGQLWACWEDSWRPTSDLLSLTEERDKGYDKFVRATLAKHPGLPVLQPGVRFANVGLLRGGEVVMPDDPRFNAPWAMSLDDEEFTRDRAILGLQAASTITTDMNDARMLCRVAAAPLMRDHLQYAYDLLGTGGNGKGCFLKALLDFYGPLGSTFSFADFAGIGKVSPTSYEQAGVPLTQRLLAVDSDAPDPGLGDLGRLNKAISGEEVSVRLLGFNARMARAVAVMVIASNRTPSIASDPSQNRRWRFVNFDRTGSVVDDWRVALERDALMIDLFMAGCVEWMTDPVGVNPRPNLTSDLDDWGMETLTRLLGVGTPDCVLSSCYRPVWREFSFRKSGRF